MVDKNIESENVQNYLTKTAAIMSSKTSDTMAKQISYSSRSRFIKSEFID